MESSGRYPNILKTDILVALRYQALFETLISTTDRFGTTISSLETIFFEKFIFDINV